MIMQIPENYQTVMPYLILKDVSGFIHFTTEVFEAILLSQQLDDNQRIRHAEIKIGDSTIMMGESFGEWGVCQVGLFVYVENADSTLQRALNQGAETIMEIEDKEYGRTCGIKDPFGNTWWITSL